jgi:hypothetical protein
MDMRVIALAAACAVTAYVATAVESRKTHRVELTFAEYRERVAKDSEERARKLLELQLMHARDRELAEEKLHEQEKEIAAKRTQLSDYGARLERLQRSEKARTVAVPENGGATATSSAAASAAGEELSGTIGGTALQMMPEADEYLLRLRECQLYIQPLWEN